MLLDHLTKRSFHYFDHPLKHKFWALMKHRALFFIATGLMGLFLPIYLLTEGKFSIEMIALLYGVASLVYVLLIPHMRHVINTLHIQSSLITAVIFFSLYLATLAYGVPYDISLVVLAFIFLIGFRFLYFTPYITEFASQTEGGQTTRQVGMIQIIKMVTNIFAPFLAGYIVAYYSYNVLYGIAIFFMLLSIVPLTELGKEKHVEFTWTSKEVWRNYRKYLKTKASYAYIALGMETFMILFIWPIVLYIVLKGDVLLVGFVATAISIVMIIVQALISKLMDTKMSRRKSARLMTPLSALGWVGKVFVTSTGGLVIIGIYHDFTKMFVTGSIGSLEADTIRESKDYMDEFISVREMYIHTGRFLAALFVIILLTTFGVQTTLWIAVVGTLLQIGFLKKDMVIKGQGGDDHSLEEKIPEEATITFEEVPEARFGAGEEVR